MSGYATYNYGLNNLTYNGENNNLQDEQSQAYHNNLMQSSYQQNHMDYNYNSYNTPAQEQTNAQQNPQPNYYYEHSGGSYYTEGEDKKPQNL